MKRPIRIWRWKNAPKKYQKLYSDDVDWVAFIPEEVLKEEGGWIPF